MGQNATWPTRTHGPDCRNGTPHRKCNTPKLLAKHLDNGRLAEALARRYLLNRGLQVVTENYHCRYGELDLIMRDAGLLVIVETRYRRQSTFGGPIESISAVKRQKIVRSTQHFINKYPAYRNVSVRFDVIGLTGTLKAPDIHWIAGAFTLEDM
ncbi:MAG: YraN family protein [Gammaproteobacteria bacterium]|nr:MAG: YraN family protein [Gammaproteobacteria bacterium]